MWNDWGAQQVFYSTEMKGIMKIYQEANFAPDIMPVSFFGLFNLNNILKGMLDACMLLTWTNAINVPNTLAPVEWGFITYKDGAAGTAS